MPFSIPHYSPTVLPVQSRIRRSKIRNKFKFIGSIIISGSGTNNPGSGKKFRIRIHNTCWQASRQWFMSALGWTTVDSSRWWGKIRLKPTPCFGARCGHRNSYCMDIVRLFVLWRATFSSLLYCMFYKLAVIFTVLAGVPPFPHPL